MGLSVINPNTLRCPDSMDMIGCKSSILTQPAVRNRFSARRIEELELQSILLLLVKTYKIL